MDWPLAQGVTLPLSRDIWERLQQTPRTRGQEGASTEHGCMDAWMDECEKNENDPDANRRPVVRSVQIFLS